jgi:hypothetical protein
MDLVGSGLLYKPVASRLGITERGVRYHMAEVFALLHVHSRHEAVAVVQDHCRTQSMAPRRYPTPVRVLSPAWPPLTHGFPRGQCRGYVRDRN